MKQIFKLKTKDKHKFILSNDYYLTYEKLNDRSYFYIHYVNIKGNSVAKSININFNIDNPKENQWIQIKGSLKTGFEDIEYLKQFYDFDLNVCNFVNSNKYLIALIYLYCNCNDFFNIFILKELTETELKELNSLKFFKYENILKAV